MTSINLMMILSLIFFIGSAQATVQTYRAQSYRALPLTSTITPITLPTTVTPPTVLSTTPVLPVTTPILSSIHRPIPITHIQAQERQGQHFDSYPSESTSSGQIQNPSVDVSSSPVQSLTQPESQVQNQQFQPLQQQQQQPQYPYYVYAQPLPQPTGNGNTPPLSIRMYSPSPYQAMQGRPEFDTEGQQPHEVASGSSWYSKYHVNDALVGLAVLGLVGSGGALWYHQLYSKTKSSRALMEFAEQFTTPDTIRMARSVYRAIQKFSAMNNQME